MKRYLAIDIGASSGRHIVGWPENGQWRTDEVYRFPNGVQERDGHLTARKPMQRRYRSNIGMETPYWSTRESV